MNVSRLVRGEAPGLLSRIVRGMARQTSDCPNSTVLWTMVSSLNARRTSFEPGQQTGGGAPIPVHAHPVRLSLINRKIEGVGHRSALTSEVRFPPSKLKCNCLMLSSDILFIIDTGLFLWLYFRNKYYTKSEVLFALLVSLLG